MTETYQAPELVNSQPGKLSVSAETRTNRLHSGQFGMPCNEEKGLYPKWFEATIQCVTHI
jgi:hypothetical protein